MIKPEEINVGDKFLITKSFTIYYLKNIDLINTIQICDNKSFSNNWFYIGFNIQNVPNRIDGNHCELVKINIPAKTTNDCKCDIMLLMSQGCKCGCV